MALSFEEMCEIEDLKHKHKLELLKISNDHASTEHARKIIRMEKLLEIALAGDVAPLAQ